MKVDVLNIEGKKVDSTELPSPIFEAPIREDLMHQAFVRQLANARLGTHSWIVNPGCNPFLFEGLS